MDLIFETKLANNYTSQSQKIRILTEHWVGRGQYQKKYKIYDFF